ncbi:MAG: TauD/TfdA family dioxygenase [Pseudomonadales bacterium]
MNDVAGKPIVDARAWRGAELVADSDWVTRLSPEQVASLYRLADELPANSADWLQFNIDELMSQPAAEVVANASAELAAGRGFVLLRGLDAGDVERLRRVFWAVGSGLGEPVMQNARGEVLSIIADRFAGAERGVDTRGYESNDELRFHCDGGDCIGMSCVRQAPEGGGNGLVSLFAIYNEILSNHPEHLDVLMQGYPLYARKEKGDPESIKKLGKVQQTRIPVFAWQNTRMSTWLNIQLAELAAQVSGQAFSDAERAALTCVEEIANQSDLQLTFKQEPGDVLFINNLAVMHRREKYIDAEDEDRKRMLYRMWINLHESRPLVSTHAALRLGIRGPEPVIAEA